MRTKPTLATTELAALLTKLQQLPTKPKWLSISAFAVAAKQQMAVLEAATTGKAERQKLARELRLFIRRARGAWLLRRGAAGMPVCLKVGNAKRNKQSEAVIFRDFFAWAGRESPTLGVGPTPRVGELRSLLLEAGLVQAKKQYARYQVLASKEAAAVPQLSAAVKELRLMLIVGRALCV